jgi:hypothetical protein
MIWIDAQGDITLVTDLTIRRNWPLVENVGKFVSCDSLAAIASDAVSSVSASRPNPMSIGSLVDMAHEVF